MSLQNNPLETNPTSLPERHLLTSSGLGPIRTAEQITELLSDKVRFPDFSEQVRKLAEHGDALWSSSAPGSFKPNGKIDFLHLSNDGTFTLTVIKPGTKYTTTAQIDAGDVSDIREEFEIGLKWDLSRSPERWNNESLGNAPGNIFFFWRTLDLKNGSILGWRGNHINQYDGTVTATDKLEITKISGISSAE